MDLGPDYQRVKLDYRNPVHRIAAARLLQEGVSQKAYPLTRGKNAIEELTHDLGSPLGFMKGVVVSTKAGGVVGFGYGFTANPRRVAQFFSVRDLDGTRLETELISMFHDSAKRPVAVLARLMVAEEFRGVGIAAAIVDDLRATFVGEQARVLVTVARVNKRMEREPFRERCERWGLVPIRGVLCSNDNYEAMGGLIANLNFNQRTPSRSAAKQTGAFAR